MKKSRTCWVFGCTALVAWCVSWVAADEIAKPWGTVHGNIYGTQSSDDPALKFSSKWYKGAKTAWKYDARANGLDRMGGRGSITFDEAGNLYIRSSSGGGTGGDCQAFSMAPTGVLRWKGTTDGSTKHGLGGFRHTSIVVGDGGPTGRCYAVGVNGGSPIAVAYSKATGIVVWQTAIAGCETDLTPILYEGKLFIIGNQTGGIAKFYCLDSATGAILGTSDLAVLTSGNGQMAMVPNAFGAGKHGIYFNVDGGVADPEMYGVLVDTTGAPITAVVQWTAQSSNNGRSHVNYMAALNRLVICTYWDRTGNNLSMWDPDGTNESFYRGQVWTDGFYDFAAQDFNGRDLICGGGDGKMIRFMDFQPGGPPEPTVYTIYDAGGFESFSLGAINGQDGWTGTAEGTSGVAPQVVDASGGDPVVGTKAVRLAVGDSAGDKSIMERALSDAIADGFTVINVSFDCYRTSEGGTNFGLENLWWWAAGNNPIYGLQWDQGPNTLPNGWNSGAGSTPTLTDKWTTVTLKWDRTTGKAYSWYDGTLVDDGIAMGGINEFIGWHIELAHDAGTGTGAEVAWIDNLLITGQKGGGTGGPTSDGYYQLPTFFGDMRILGALYKDAKGDSIVVNGTRGNGAGNPDQDSRVYAFNATKGKLIKSCADIDDAPVYIDNFKIVGSVSGTVLDTAGFEGYALGDLAGQANPGGIGSLDASGWQNDNYGAGGGGTPVQVIEDPLDTGHGKVISIDALQSCGGTKGIKALLAAPVSGEVVTVSWDQYRADRTDNLWYDNQENWYAYQWDSNRMITPRGADGTPVWVGPLTAGVWQHIDYVFDYTTFGVKVIVDGTIVGESFLDLDEVATNGWSWRVEATTITESKSVETPRIFEYRTGIVDIFYDTHGGPVMGPLTPGVAPQQIYYTDRTTGHLVAIGPACNAPLSDIDGDGDVDLADFGTFQSCFNGPNRPAAIDSADCACLDADDDDDVDLVDFGTFQSCFNGPNRPPACP